MTVEVNKESHEVIDAINLRLSADAARQLAGLLVAVPVNFSTDVFDNIADGLARELNYDVPWYAADSNNEYGPLDIPETSDCGCGNAAYTDEDYEADLITSGSY